MRTDARLQVRADPRCIVAARRAVGERCQALSAVSDLEAIELMVSELVTNVIRHTPTGEGEVRLLLDDRTVRVEVEDGGDGPRGVPAVADCEQGGGFGLQMVDRLADRWGVQRRSCVWFEVDVERRRAAAPSRPSPERRRRVTV